MKCIFVTDLHGHIKRFKALFKTIANEKPDAVFIGGDILPNQFLIDDSVDSFIDKELLKPIKKVKEKVGKNIRFFVIMGNDDPRVFEKKFLMADKEKIIDYVNFKTVKFNDLFVTGYCYVPPTPFQLKDWERYDVSRFVDVGAVSPEEGIRTVEVDKDEIIYSTISEDLKKLVKNSPTDKTIFLFHSPPYNSNLDRADLDNKHVDNAPLDTHIGSIAIQRFIEKNQPYLTLHGHVHESFRLTDKWMEKKGKTVSISAAYDGPELAVVSFETNDIEKATWKLIKII